MIPHPLLAAALLTLALAVAFVVGAAARALILAATRHGRHVREFDRDLDQACGYEAGSGELRELPAPGETIYTDHNVWLPRTPQTSPAGPVPGEEPRLRTERQLDGPPHRDAGRTWVTDRPGTPPGERAVPDVAENLCHCGKPAGHLLADLAGDHPETAFDTGVIPAVIA